MHYYGLRYVNIRGSEAQRNRRKSALLKAILTVAIVSVKNGEIGYWPTISTNKRFFRDRAFHASLSNFSTAFKRALRAWADLSEAP